MNCLVNVFPLRFHAAIERHSGLTATFQPLFHACLRTRNAIHPCTVCTAGAKTKQDFVAENPVTPGHTSPMAEDIFGTKNGFEYVVLG